MKAEITLSAQDKNLDEVQSFILNSIEKENITISPKLSMQLELAIEEIFVNIAHYSGSETATIKCLITNCEKKDDSATKKITISFYDSGTPFNPLEKEDPDISLSMEERAIGGLGIFLTKKYMDKVSYEYKNKQNILTLEKKLF